MSQFLGVYMAIIKMAVNAEIIVLFFINNPNILGKITNNWLKMSTFGL